MSGQLALGLDFGTAAVRAILLDADSGQELASSAALYPSGVLSRALPNGRPLPPDWALQDPADWLASLELAVCEVVRKAGVDRRRVRAIGIDATSCTLLPVRATGVPLCQVDEWADEPHAWPKLWKHHAAHAQATELTDHAVHSQVPWLRRYGGRISSEWLVPKAAQILDEAPRVYAAADVLVEAGDWLVWQLTGALVRNNCAAGFKAFWSKADGYPAENFLGGFRPGLANLFAEKAGGEVTEPGMFVGYLRPEWAGRLGLGESVAVAAAIVDAHAGLLGAGVTQPRSLYLATGTSTCHLVLAPWERSVAGICGVVEDGIIAGSYAYEAGQAAAGDTFNWYAQLVGRSHVELTAAADRLRPGQSGVLALDWWNGCRTPLVDADLSGALIGLGLETPPEAIYRALLEAHAFGTKLVVDTFADAGILVDHLVVGGGLAANPLMLQLYADVTGLPVEVVASEHPSARGAAILGAAAAGMFPDVTTATAATAQPAMTVLEPSPQAHATYRELYQLYRELGASYGSEDSLLKRLLAVRRQVARATSGPSLRI